MHIPRNVADVLEKCKNKPKQQTKTANQAKNKK